MHFRITLHNPEVYEIQILAHPWWELGLLSISVLFILLLGLYVFSFARGRKNSSWISEDIPSGILNTSLAAVGIRRTSIVLSSMSMDEGFSWVNVWVTRLFIAIVLISAALFLVSQYPGLQSPFWLGLALQGFTYSSAFIFYVSGGDES